MTELWKSIPGLDGYQVSTHGRVRSYRKKGGGRKTKPHMLSPGPKGKYKFVSLPHADKKQFSPLVHRIVLEVFAGPCPDGMEACHYDGDPTNNRLDNLRWDSRVNNGADTKRVNASKKGRKASFLKAIETRQREILRRYLILRAIEEVEAGQMTQRKIAAKYGVTEFHLSRMRNGRYEHKTLKEFQLN